MAFKDGKRVVRKAGTYIGSAKKRREISNARKPSNTYTTVKTKDSRKPSASHTTLVKQSNTKTEVQKTGDVALPLKKPSKTTGPIKKFGRSTNFLHTDSQNLSSNFYNQDINMQNISSIEDKKRTANTDFDKRFNSYGGNDRLDSNRGLMSLAKYKTAYNKGVQSLKAPERVGALSTIFKFANYLTGNKNQSLLDTSSQIQNVYNQSGYGLIKGKKK